MQEERGAAADNRPGDRREQEPLDHRGEHDEGLDVIESLHGASYWTGEIAKSNLRRSAEAVGYSAG